MITKHFFKALLLFAGMIILGLAGIFLVSYLDKEKTNDKIQNNTIEIKTCEKGGVC